MANEEAIQRQYQLLRIFAFALLIGAPLISLYLVRMILQGGTIDAHPNSIILYGGLALAASMGGLASIIKKSAMSAYRRNSAKFESLTKCAQSVGIVPIAPVEACYVLGVAVFFLTGLTNGLPYFYAIGVLYSIFYWPTEARFRRIVEQLEAK